MSNTAAIRYAPNRRMIASVPSIGARPGDRLLPARRWDDLQGWGMHKADHDKGLAAAERGELARLRALSLHDPVTGVYNGAYFEGQAESEWIRALRHRRALSIVVLEISDLDEFRARFGASICNEWLTTFGQRCLLELRRGGDLMARIGPDRFALLLPETDIDGTRMMAERLRLASVSTRTTLSEAGNGEPQVHIGAACLSADCLGEKGWRGALAMAENAAARSKLQQIGAPVVLEVVPPTAWKQV